MSSRWTANSTPSSKPKISAGLHSLRLTCRISDGVKVAERWRTTEMVEKANVDEREYDFLYEDSEGFHFMEPATYEQITVHPDVVGDDKAFLTDGIKVYLKAYEGVAIALELPQRVAVEITETEPVTKGQAASSSYRLCHLLERDSRHGSPPISALAPGS